MNKQNLKTKEINSKGITLVALIITIIVLLILAIVSISLVVNNGILNKAQHGVEKYSDEEEFEQIKLAVASAMLKGNGFLNIENLNNEIKAKYGENKEVFETQNGWIYNSYIIDKNGNIDKRLPKEFKEVEFIESTGTQLITTKIQEEYIDYEFTFDVEFLFEYTDLAKSFLGDMSGNFYCGGTGVGWYTISYGGEKYNNSKVILNKRTHNVLRAAPGIQEWIADDKKVVSASKEDILNTNKPISLFKGRNNFGDYGNPTKIRLYSMKIIIYSQNQIAGNFIPCKSITSVTNAEGEQVPANTKGLYDLVTGEFYTNKGTGEDFIAGPEV